LRYVILYLSKKVFCKSKIKRTIILMDVQASKCKQWANRLRVLLATLCPLQFLNGNSTDRYKIDTRWNWTAPGLQTDCMLIFNKAELVQQCVSKVFPQFHSICYSQLRKNKELIFQFQLLVISEKLYSRLRNI
jgi:hypothetical protein